MKRIIVTGILVQADGVMKKVAGTSSTREVVNRLKVVHGIQHMNIVMSKAAGSMTPTKAVAVMQLAVHGELKHGSGVKRSDVGISMAIRHHVKT